MHRQALPGNNGIDDGDDGKHGDSDVTTVAVMLSVLTVQLLMLTVGRSRRQGPW